MKINPKELSRALKIIRPVVSQTSVLPILKSVKIIDNEIIGTNLGVSIKERIDIEEGSGTFLFPLAELSNICNVSTDTLVLQPDKITSGRDKYKLGHPNDIAHFPKFEDDIEGVSLTVHEDVIQAIVKASRFVDKEPMLPLGNVNIYWADGILAVTGTNGHAFYKNTFKIESESDGVLLNILLPSDFVKSLTSLSGACDIVVSESKISVTNGSTTIIGTLAEGRYPDTSVIFKERQEDVVEINKNDLLDCLVKVSGVYSMLPACILSFKEADKIVFTVSNDINEAVAVIDLPHVIKTEAICLNANFFIDLLNSLPPNVQDVELHIYGKSASVIITSTETEVKLAIHPLLLN